MVCPWQPKHEDDPAVSDLVVHDHCPPLVMDLVGGVSHLYEQITMYVMVVATSFKQDVYSLVSPPHPQEAIYHIFRENYLAQLSLADMVPYHPNTPSESFENAFLSTRSSSPSPASSFAAGEIITNSIFGICALAVGVATIWQGNRLWRLWRASQHHHAYELEGILSLELSPQ